MRCTSPRTVGFKADGKTISWSPKQTSNEYATFQLPCGKCIDCRLDYARQWAIRCVHESKMHAETSFITLTYSDEHLKSPRLIYEDFQNFMKKLRKTRQETIGLIVAGEYGEKTKRPHWHAILFGYRPRDLKPLRKNERGDQIYSSLELDKLWAKNNSEQKPNEIGDVTIHSAGYVARYAAKKLVHGKDADHDFHPLFKASSKYAIGKKWLEKNWLDVFSHGRLVLQDGKTSTIPRYYEKWLKKEHPLAWNNYVTKIKSEKTAAAAAKEEKEKQRYAISLLNTPYTHEAPITRAEMRRAIQEQRFELLQQHLKL